MGRSFAWRGSTNVERAAETFRATFLTLLEKVVTEGDALIGDLGPGVFALVLPPPDGPASSALDNHQDAVDDALARIAQRRGNVASVTWAVLRDAAPAYEPDFRSWAGPHTRLLEGDIGIVFFVEPTAVARAVERAAGRHRLRAHLDEDEARVLVGDSQYLAELQIDALVAEALWTMRGLTAVAFEQVALLPEEFAAFDELAEALVRRFPGLALLPDGDSWSTELGPTCGHVSYRHLQQQRLVTGLDADALLARARLSDLFEDGSAVHRKIKPTSFVGVFPDVIYRQLGSCVEVMARDSDAGTRYIRRYDDDPPGRLDHLTLLATLAHQHHEFEGHMFRAEIGPRQALCLAGRQAVSLLAEPELIAGVLEAAGWARWRVRLFSTFEHGLIIADHDLTDEAFEVLTASTRLLAEDLFEDAGDAMAIDLSMQLDEPATGRCVLREVPGTFFELRERSTDAEQGAPPGRSAYYRGLCYEILGQSERAADCFSRALRYDRDDGELNLLLGRTLNDLGDFERATAFLENAVRALPDDPDASNSLGVAYQSVGDSQEAVRAFEHAAALSPEDPTILVNLGRAYFDTDRLDFAREVLSRAIERAPALFEAHASLAMLHFRSGERDDALEHARVALAERPDDETMRELVALLVTEGGEP